MATELFKMGMSEAVYTTKSMSDPTQYKKCMLHKLQTMEVYVPWQNNGLALE